uniref:PX domain-containing protein n=1 Tax=Noctiluca scintillans TaxID=2966 RepID=A0A7S1A6G9_NOCSC
MAQEYLLLREMKLQVDSPSGSTRTMPGCPRSVPGTQETCDALLRAPFFRGLRSQTLQAQVQEHHVVEGPKFDHVEYTIRVRHNQKTWKVNRRFSQFVRLKTELRRLGIAMPRLPPRISLGILEPTSDMFCQQRQKRLNFIMQELLKDGIATEALCIFLDFLPKLQSSLSSLPEDEESF